MTLREHVRDLSSLGFTYLNSACIIGIIDTDIEILKQEVMQCEQKFELVDGAEEYNINLEAQNERNGTNKTRQEDYLEYVRSIWRRWESKRNILTHITKAVKLVVLMQTQSAFLERVFSQVRLVTNEIGEEALRDNIKRTVMRRIKNDLMG